MPRKKECPLQKQYRKGYPVEKTIRVTAKMWGYICEYADVFGMTPEQAATHLLGYQTAEIINRGFIQKARGK